MGQSWWRHHIQAATCKWMRSSYKWALELENVVALLYSQEMTWTAFEKQYIYTRPNTASLNYIEALSKHPIAASWVSCKIIWILHDGHARLGVKKAPFNLWFVRLSQTLVILNTVNLYHSCCTTYKQSIAEASAYHALGARHDGLEILRRSHHLHHLAVLVSATWADVPYRWLKLPSSETCLSWMACVDLGWTEVGVNYAMQTATWWCCL